MADTKTKTGITQVATVIVPVKDQEKAIDFFCETLGFEKTMDAGFGDRYRWVEVAPEKGSSTTVALAPPPEGSEIEIGGETGCSFSTEDADATHATLKDAGVDVDDEVMRMGDPVPPMFTFRDPEANVYRVVERPRA
jgi:catechol 2,3-dioxygenase-like lactoylglutathione lyase family enzyme